MSGSIAPDGKREPMVVDQESGTALLEPASSISDRLATIQPARGVFEHRGDVHLALIEVGDHRFLRACQSNHAIAVARFAEELKDAGIVIPRLRHGEPDHVILKDVPREGRAFAELEEAGIAARFIMAGSAVGVCGLPSASYGDDGSFALPEPTIRIKKCFPGLDLPSGVQALTPDEVQTTMEKLLGERSLQGSF